MVTLIFAVLAATPLQTRQTFLRAEKPEPRYESLRALAKPMGDPKPGEWLESHDEDGQSFAEYVASNPVRPAKERRTIYIQLVGDFSEAQSRVVKDAADYIGRFFALP